MSESSIFTSLSEMVHQHITNGSHIYLEGLLVNRLPMAAVHEVIRADLRELRIVSAPNGLAVDQLIGAGLVTELEFYFLGFMTQNGFATMRRFREAAETGTIRVKESMGYAICMALRAGAFGIPFIPLPDFRGSDLLSHRKEYKIMKSPYGSKDTIITVPALKPDILLLHAHAADAKGNIILEEPWTNFTLTTAQACNKVLVTVEEIHEEKTFNSSNITIPHFLVDAIAKVPYGATPTALNHRYEINDAHINLYQEMAQTQEGFDEYLQTYIRNCPTQSTLLEKIGAPPPWLKSKTTETAREGN